MGICGNKGNDSPGKANRYKDSHEPGRASENIDAHHRPQSADLDNHLGPGKGNGRLTSWTRRDEPKKQEEQEV